MAVFIEEFSTCEEAKLAALTITTQRDASYAKEKNGSQVNENHAIIKDMDKFQRLVNIIN